MNYTHHYRQAVNWYFESLSSAKHNTNYMDYTESVMINNLQYRSIVHSLVSSPESGADVLISPCTSRKLGCFESWSSSNNTDSLVEMKAPLCLIRCVDGKETL